jgi:hypothetical protein
VPPATGWSHRLACGGRAGRISVGVPAPSVPATPRWPAPAACKTAAPSCSRTRQGRPTTRAGAGPIAPCGPGAFHGVPLQRTGRGGAGCGRADDRALATHQPHWTPHGGPRRPAPNRARPSFPARAARSASINAVLMWDSSTRVSTIAPAPSPLRALSSPHCRQNVLKHAACSFTKTAQSGRRWLRVPPPPNRPTIGHNPWDGHRRVWHR